MNVNRSTSLFVARSGARSRNRSYNRCKVIKVSTAKTLLRDPFKLHLHQITMEEEKLN